MKLRFRELHGQLRVAYCAAGFRVSAVCCHGLHVGLCRDDEQHHIGEVLDVFVSMPMMCSYICIMPTCMSPCGCVLLFCSLSPPLSHLLLCMSVCLCLILSASISHCHTLVLSVLFSLSLSGCLLILCACLPFVCLSLIIVKSFVGFFNFS